MIRPEYLMAHWSLFYSSFLVMKCTQHHTNFIQRPILLHSRQKYSSHYPKLVLTFLLNMKKSGKKLCNNPVTTNGEGASTSASISKCGSASSLEVSNNSTTRTLPPVIRTLSHINIGPRSKWCNILFEGAGGGQELPLCGQPIPEPVHLTPCMGRRVWKQWKVGRVRRNLSDLPSYRKIQGIVVNHIRLICI